MSPKALSCARQEMSWAGDNGRNGPTQQIKRMIKRAIIAAIFDLNAGMRDGGAITTKQVADLG